MAKYRCSIFWSFAIHCDLLCYTLAGLKVKMYTAICPTKKRDVYIKESLTGLLSPIPNRKDIWTLNLCRKRILIKDSMFSYYFKMWLLLLCYNLINYKIYVHCFIYLLVKMADSIKVLTVLPFQKDRITMLFLIGNTTNMKVMLITCNVMVTNACR